MKEEGARSRFLKAFNDILPRNRRIRMVAMKLDIQHSLFLSPPLPGYLARDELSIALARIYSTVLLPPRREMVARGSTNRGCVHLPRAKAPRERKTERRSRRANRTDAAVDTSLPPRLLPSERTNERTSRFMPVHSPNEPFAPSNPPGTIILLESRKLPGKNDTLLSPNPSSNFTSRATTTRRDSLLSSLSLSRSNHPPCLAVMRREERSLRKS